MGIFGIGERKKESVLLGVCIPNHKKTAAKEGESGAKTIDNISLRKVDDEKYFSNSKKSSGRCVFRVDGKYEVGNTLMISGMVESGTLKKGMKSEIGRGEIRIMELRVGSEKVDEIEENREGTIFVRARGPQNIKYGDLLEFD